MTPVQTVIAWLLVALLVTSNVLIIVLTRWVTRITPRKIKKRVSRSFDPATPEIEHYKNHAHADPERHLLNKLNDTRVTLTSTGPAQIKIPPRRVKRTNVNTNPDSDSEVNK